MYEGVVKDSPASPEGIAATELAGRAFYSLGDHARTVETFHELLKKTAPAGDAEITAEGTSFFGKKQFSNAVEHYHAYLINSTEGDDTTRAGCELALCFAELKQWDDALDTFAIMQKFESDELVTETTQYLAEKAYDANEKDVAEKFYLSMIAPSNPQAVISRGLSGLAWVNMESTDNAKALAVFKQLTKDFLTRQGLRPKLQKCTRW